MRAEADVKQKCSLVMNQYVIMVSQLVVQRRAEDETLVQYKQKDTERNGQCNEGTMVK
jgi:hypothetical protein